MDECRRHPTLLSFERSAHRLRSQPICSGHRRNLSPICGPKGGGACTPLAAPAQLHNAKLRSVESTQRRLKRDRVRRLANSPGRGEFPPRQNSAIRSAGSAFRTWSVLGPPLPAPPRTEVTPAHFARHRPGAVPQNAPASLVGRPAWRSMSVYDLGVGNLYALGAPSGHDLNSTEVIGMRCSPCTPPRLRGSDAESDPLPQPADRFSGWCPNARPQLRRQL
jgi:hypothetical protein